METQPSHAQPKKKGLPPQKRKQLLTAVGLIIGFFVIWGVYQHFFFVTTDNAQVQGRTVMLSPKVAGYVIKVNVQENQKVKAGEVLVQIDSRDYQNSTEQVESERSSLEARVRDAESNFKRLDELFKSGAVSRQQFDNAKATYLELSRKLQAVQSQVEQAKLNLAYTHILAPTDGVVARKSVEAGMFAPVGVPLLGFVSSDERWVNANFKETELGRIAVGKKVDIEVDAVPGRSFQGEVESISPATGATFTLLPPDNATGNFTKVVQRVPVRIKLPGLSPEDISLLQVGLSANVRIHTR